MKIIFAGTPDLAVASLDALLTSSHDVVAVLTREDAPIGRKRVMTSSPVAVAAMDRGIPVIKANRITPDVATTIASYHPDLGVVVAYGGLLPQDALDIPTNGWINLHFSRLPELRGAAPAQRDLLRGATEGSFSIFQLVLALDAGDVFATGSIPLDGHETSGDVLTQLSTVGASDLLTVVNDIASGVAVSTPQTGEITLAPKLRRDDAHLLPVEGLTQTYNRFRAVTPEPGAWFDLAGIPVKVLSARPAQNAMSVDLGVVSLSGTSVLLDCGDGQLELLTVQPAGKQAMAASDWFRGLRSSEPIRAE